MHTGKKLLMKMLNIHFNNYEEIAEYLIEADENGSFVEITSYLDDATEIMRELLMYDIVVGAIEIEQKEICGYKDEYLITVCNGLLFVEKAFDSKSDRYLSTDADIILLCDGSGYDAYKDRGEVCVFTYNVGEKFDCCECNDDALNNPFEIRDHNGNVIGTFKINIEL